VAQAPILHLNGYKIANPTVLARIPHEELEALMRGYGYAPHFAERGIHEAPRLADDRHFVSALDFQPRLAARIPLAEPFAAGRRRPALD